MSSKLQANPIFKQYGRLHKEDVAKEAAENKSNKDEEAVNDDAGEAATASAPIKQSSTAKNGGDGNAVDDEDDFENIEAEIQRIKHEASSKPKQPEKTAPKSSVPKASMPKSKAAKHIAQMLAAQDPDEFPDLEGYAPQFMSSSVTTVDNPSVVAPSRRHAGGGAISTARIKEELNEGNISVSSSSDGDDEDEESNEDAAPAKGQGNPDDDDGGDPPEAKQPTSVPDNRDPSRYNDPASPLGNDDEHSECIMANPSAVPAFVRDPTVAIHDGNGELDEELPDGDTQTKDDLITDASDVLSSFQFKDKGKGKQDRKKVEVPREPIKPEAEEEEEEDEWDAANNKMEEALESNKNDVTSQAIYPISFWEAVILLKRDKKSYQDYLPQAWMKRDPGTRPLPLRPPPQLPVYEKKKDIFSIFGCCGKSSSKEVADSKTANGLSTTTPAQTALKSKDDDSEPKAPPNIAHDADFVEAMKKCPFSHTNLTHRRILFTIYHALTSTPGGAFKPSTGVYTPWWQRRQARKGSSTVLYTESTNINAEPSSESVTARHGTKPQDAPLPIDNIDWDRIGFQGTNPATDLRDSGLVALLTTLFLIDYYPLLMQKVWATCHPPQPPQAPTETKSKKEKEKADLSRLPFVLIAFNFTAATLDALNLGMLRKAITRYDCDLTKDTPSSPVLLQSVVDLESEKTATSLSKIQAPVEALSTPAYCKPTPSEQRLRQRAPVLFTCCEYFVGIMCLFWENWLKRQKQKRPVLLTVADFGTEKATLRQRVAVSGKENGVFVATAKARYGAVLNSFEDQINVV